MALITKYPLRTAELKTPYIYGSSGTVIYIKVNPLKIDAGPLIDLLQERTIADGKGIQ